MAMRDGDALAQRAELAFSTEQLAPTLSAAIALAGMGRLQPPVAAVSYLRFHRELSSFRSYLLVFYFMRDPTRVTYSYGCVGAENGEITFGLFAPPLYSSCPP